MVPDNKAVAFCREASDAPLNKFLKRLCVSRVDPLFLEKHWRADAALVAVFADQKATGRGIVPVREAWVIPISELFNLHKEVDTLRRAHGFHLIDVEA